MAESTWFFVFLKFTSFKTDMSFLISTAAATLGATLARHRSKSRIYIGCMKSGPVLAQK